MLLFRFVNEKYDFSLTFLFVYSAVHTLYVYYYIVKALTQRNKVLMSVTTELLPWGKDVNLTVGLLSPYFTIPNIKLIKCINLHFRWSLLSPQI